MTITTSAVLRAFGLPAIAAALLLSSQSGAPRFHETGLDRAGPAFRSAAAVTPGTFHHWPTPTKTAAVDPNTFHHWPTPTMMASVDPGTFHHWPTSQG